MYEKFSDRSRHAMALANLEAGKLNHDYIAPAHLMLGLIAEGECVASEAMTVLHVDIDRVRKDVRARLEKGQSDKSVGRRAHTTAMKGVIDKAIKEARRFGHRYVGTEHVLLALLQQEDAIPFMVLKKQGLDVDQLRDQARDLLQAPIDAAHDISHSRHGEHQWIHQQEIAKAFRSPRFWRTMILAIDVANRKGAAEIEPLHMLLALLRDPDSNVAEMLAEKGVTADWILERITE